MIDVKIPSNNIEERSYAVRMVLGHFLGLDYTLHKEHIEQTEICWGDNRVIFSDVLWKGDMPLSYLREDNFPRVRQYSTYLAPEGNIPALYSNGEFEVSDNTIKCPIDVFASVFFMLTRWEEYVNKKRDEYGRFVGIESVAYMNHFLDRPIVNEYAEMVWNILKEIGFNKERKTTQFELVPTHDIDHPFMKKRILKSFYYVTKSLLKLDLPSVRCYIKDLFRDPYDVFNFFMDCSESIGVKSRFYFMSADPGTGVKHDSPYMADSRFTRIVNSIKSRGHIVGFHPGVFSQESTEAWSVEKSILENKTGVTIEEGRQHYLCFSIPNSFLCWETNRMKIDSTLSYHDIEGFRCGTGMSYPVFNILERKEYALMERPLVVMDATLTGYRQYNLEKIKEVLQYYLNVGRKYKMPITILFHNSSFIGNNGNKLKTIYRELFKQINNESSIS